MLQIDLTSDVNRLEGSLKLLTDRAISFAAARSMTAAVRKAEADMKAAITSASGPIEGGATRWTVGALRSNWARADNLVAEVGFRSDTPRAAGRYLQPLIKGGRPRTKGVDLRVSTAISGGGRGVLIPAGSTRVDRRGNVTYGSLGKALQGLGQKGSGLFIRPLRRGGSFGIFQRSDGFIGRTSTLERRTQLLFSIDTTPKPRVSTFKLHEQLRKSVDQIFPGHYRASLEAELRRAGFR
jgi:hypothetical protein